MWSTAFRESLEFFPRKDASETPRGGFSASPVSVRFISQLPLISYLSCVHCVLFRKARLVYSTFSGVGVQINLVRVYRSAENRTEGLQKTSYCVSVLL